MVGAAYNSTYDEIYETQLYVRQQDAAVMDRLYGAVAALRSIIPHEYLTTVDPYYQEIPTTPKSKNIPPGKASK